MGTYYRVVCDNCREFIKLNAVNDCGDKYNNLGPALICAAALWYGDHFRVVSDGSSFYEEMEEEGYKDVSLAAASEARERGWLNDDLVAYFDYNHKKVEQ